MSDLFATGIQIPNLPTGQARPADIDGFLRIFARQNALFGRLPDGTEIPLSGGGGGGAVTSVNGETGDVRVSFIEAQNNPPVPTNVLATSNSVTINFNNEPRVNFAQGGVDFFSNNGAPYSFRFRDSDNDQFTGVRAPTQAALSYFLMLPDGVGAAVGQSLSIKRIDSPGVNGVHPDIVLGSKYDVKYVAGNPELTAADFEDRNQVYLTGSPAHFKVLDDDGNVRSVYNQDQSNFLYWKAGANNVGGADARTIYTQATDPALTSTVADGDLWFQV